MSDILIDVAGLTVADRAGRTVLDDITLPVRAGESVALTGPSGAGKTTLGLALLGHVRPGLAVVSGSVHVTGISALTGDPGALRTLRTEVIHYVPQDALAALTPTMRVQALLGEALQARSRRGCESAATALLDLVGLPTDRAFGRRHPHQLSGGQRQRLVLAMAVAGSPATIVLDEPTAGQDPATRDAVLGELRRLRDQTGVAFVVITHDPVTARGLADRVLRLDDGHLTPVHPAGTTRFVPAPRRGSGERPEAALLEAVGVCAGYPRGAGDTLHHVDLAVRAGECLGIIGGSGSGKTTLTRVLTGLHPASGGEVRVHGEVVDPRAGRRPAGTRRRLGMIFQDPLTSLNPARRVGRILADATGLRRIEANQAVDALLTVVGLDPAVRHRRPRALSGGQQQRVAIARALAQSPDVLIGDEMTSSLDPGTRDAICDLLDRLRVERGLALVIVSHDLDVIRRLADRVLVLDQGHVVARGTVGEVLTGPGPAARSPRTCRRSGGGSTGSNCGG